MTETRHTGRETGRETGHAFPQQRGGYSRRQASALLFAAVANNDSAVRYRSELSGNDEAINRKSLCPTDLLANSPLSQSHTSVPVDITDGYYNLSEVDGITDL
jgi:hypothetical protein